VGMGAMMDSMTFVPNLVHNLETFCFAQTNSTTCRSLNDHVVPALVASFLASFEALRERKGASNAWWGSTKDQTAPKGERLLCRALQPTTEISHDLANGYRRASCHKY